MYPRIKLKWFSFLIPRNCPLDFPHPSFMSGRFSAQIFLRSHFLSESLFHYHTILSNRLVDRLKLLRVQAEYTPASLVANLACSTASGHSSFFKKSTAWPINWKRSITEVDCFISSFSGWYLSPWIARSTQEIVVESVTSSHLFTAGPKNRWVSNFKSLELAMMESQLLLYYLSV